MQQWINHAERKQKKKPRSASLIRLISKAIYLCGDYVGILLAEWIAFHIRNLLMGNIFQVSAIYIYNSDTCCIPSGAGICRNIFQTLYQCTDVGKTV